MSTNAARNTQTPLHFALNQDLPPQSQDCLSLFLPLPHFLTLSLLCKTALTTGTNVKATSVVKEKKKNLLLLCCFFKLQIKTVGHRNGPTSKCCYRKMKGNSFWELVPATLLHLLSG